MSSLWGNMHIQFLFLLMTVLPFVINLFQACSGKFMPVMQWMYFDSLECLPEEEKVFCENSYQKVNTRYDGQIAVFGQDFQRHVLSRKYFIVSILRFCPVFL